ncbi:MAG: tryptophan synthase subunit alpha [Planctomycetaceae bacterium]
MSTLAASSRIADTFAVAKRENRLAFMPFVTAGDPDLATTLDVIRELASRGVDLIEVGVPYSDPIADGPVIQASYTRALDAGFRLDAFFDAFASLNQREEGESGREGEGAKKVRDGRAAIGMADRNSPPSPPLPLTPSRTPPLVAMVSFSIVFRYGVERFTATAARAGFSGMIVPDLPGDEAGEFAAVVRAQGLDLIELVSPLTPAERVAPILANCSGFVYCIAVAGTTGERDRLPPALTNQLGELRKSTDLPLAVGFGVSRPEHVDALRGKADGVIVGSAIVRRFERFADQPREAVIREIGEYAAEMVKACR